MVEKGQATGDKFNARNVPHGFVKCRIAMKKKSVRMRIKIRNTFIAGLV